MASPRQIQIRQLFREAVQYCKNPANRRGMKFQHCVGNYIRSRTGGVSTKRKKAKALVAVP